MPLTVLRWVDWLAHARTERAVVDLTHEYLQTWNDRELHALPATCRPGALRDGDDIAQLAFRFVVARTDGVTGAAADAFDEIQAFFQYASHRIAQILATRGQSKWPAPWQATRDPQDQPENTEQSMPNRQYLRRARRTPRNFARMLLPHERDESTDVTRVQEEPQPLMKQAEDDLASGQQDTDCRNQPPASASGESGHPPQTKN